MALIRFRRGMGTPAVLQDGEPALDLTVTSPRLFAGVNGTPVVIADPARIAALEARVRLLEQALRELQYISFTGVPTFPMPP